MYKAIEIIFSSEPEDQMQMYELCFHWEESIYSSFNQELEIAIY